MKKKRLIVWLDGLGYDEISKEKTPFLYSFAKKNSIAKLKILLSFAGIEHSFFNGNLPDEHEIFLDFKYSPRTSCFKWQRYFWFLGRNILSYTTALFQYLSGKDCLTKLYNLPFNKMNRFDISSKKPIWKLNMFKNKNYVCYKWPFLVKNGKKKLKLKYESDIERCRTLIKSISGDVDLYSVQLMGLDKIAHKYGKNTEEYNLKIKELDHLAKGIYLHFKRKFPNLEIIFWSDHAFIDIKKTIDIRNLFPKTKDYLMFAGGTTISFWFGSDDIKEKIIKILKKIKEGHILTKKDIKKYKIPTNFENGELIFVMQPGNYIYPNYYQGNKPFKAMHGYEPDKYTSDGILITNIKLKKKSYSLNEVINL